MNWIGIQESRGGELLFWWIPSLSLSLVMELTWIVINGLWKDSSLREIYTIFDTLIAGHPDPAFGGLIEYLQSYHQIE